MPDASAPPAAPRRRLGRQPALDGVRALAIGLVVLGHIDDVLRPGAGAFPGGVLGVDVFFVLSGFLITRLLLEEGDLTGRLSLARFYGRRATRLLPALALFLVGHIVWVVTTDFPITRGDEAKSLLFIVLYLGNWSHKLGSGLLFGLGHLWSLSVEEQFYLVWPCVLLVVRRRPSLLRAVIALGIVTAIVVRIALWSGEGSWIQIFSRTDARMDALLIGAALALAHASGALARVPIAARRGMAVAGLAWIVGSALVVEPSSSFLFHGGFTLVALAAAALIAGIVDDPWWLSGLLSRRGPRLIGRVSYGLYLWHGLVLVWVQMEMPGSSDAVVLAVAAVLTALVVGASWLLVERPILDWGHRRFARPGTRARPLVAHA
jgi:peptidoglycan/LPS O-acetylase OafA/YrhL